MDAFDPHSQFWKWRHRAVRRQNIKDLVFLEGIHIVHKQTNPNPNKQPALTLITNAHLQSKKFVQWVALGECVADK